MDQSSSTYSKSVPSLEQVESFRKKKRKRLQINLVLFFLLPAVGIPLMVSYQDEKAIFFSIFGVLIFNLFRHVFDYFSVYKKYEIYFKENILEQLIPAALPGVYFEATPEVDKHDILDSGLFWMWRFRAAETRGLFGGKLGDLEFDILDFVGTSRNTHRESNRETNFTGLFMMAKIPNPVSSQVIIGSSIAGMGALGKLASNILESPKIPKVSIDAPGFEGTFQVYSDSAEEAKKVLTDNRQNAILEAVSGGIGKHNIRVSFKEDHVFIAINEIVDLYKINLKRSVMNPDSVNDIFKDLLKNVKLLENISAE